jgi:CDP-diacylglycerol--serine O-phosphatidyltransferase
LPIKLDLVGMKRHVPGPWSDPQVYLLPNLMTAGNLACGFSAVVTIFAGMQDVGGGTKDFHLAIFLILAACFFDALDGRLARMKGQESMFGREFDSLADIVSFGIAPALLVMDIVLKSFDNRLGWTVAFIYLLCGAMRLARFNCLSQAASESKSELKDRDFVGFPIPAAAGLIASLTMFMIWVNEGDKDLGPWRYVLLVLMLLLSFMMLSEFRYPSFKAMNWRAKKSLIWLFVAVLVLVCAVNFVEFVPLIIFLSYLIYGLVRPWISRKWRREIEDGLDDEILEEEIAAEEVAAAELPEEPSI